MALLAPIGTHDTDTLLRIVCNGLVRTIDVDLTGITLGECCKLLRVIQVVNLRLDLADSIAGESLDGRTHRVQDTRHDVLVIVHQTAADTDDAVEQ